MHFVFPLLNFHFQRFAVGAIKSQVCERDSIVQSLRVTLPCIYLLNK